MATPDVKLAVSACLTVRFDSATCDDPTESRSCAAPQPEKTKEPTTAKELVTNRRMILYLDVCEAGCFGLLKLGYVSASLSFNRWGRVD